VPDVERKRGGEELSPEELQGHESRVPDDADLDSRGERRGGWLRRALRCVTANVSSTTIDRLSVRPLARRRRTASDSRIPVLVLADFGVEKKFSLEGLDAKAVEKEVTGVLKQSA
jgi:hypothetical protein